MKRFNSTALYKMCSLCIALASVITVYGKSYVFWGEPEFPEK